MKCPGTLATSTQLPGEMSNGSESTMNTDTGSCSCTCSQCGATFTSSFQGRVLCDLCHAYEPDRITLEAEQKESELFDTDPDALDPILIEGSQPTFGCSSKHFLPFTDQEAEDLVRHLEQTQETWGSLSSTAVEFALRTQAQLLLYRGRTWFTPRQWSFFKEIMEVIGWPASLNKAGSDPLDRAGLE